MARYIIERNVEGLEAPNVEAFRDGSLKAKETARDLGIIWIRSYVSEAEGKIYCEYEAPGPDIILEHARRIGLPADKISEVKLEISPDMFV